MITPEAFRKQAHQLVDWMADYLENIEQLPVKPGVKPGDISRQFPASAPTDGESMAHIFQDFQDIILPGMTHWQHPHFYAYFPANSSYPSLLAEMLMSTLGAQCMIWDTSPAATELEEVVMDWLRQMIGLPDTFTGVIQDTASTATLAALITAREHASNYDINRKGFEGKPQYRVYGSAETHSSIEKAVMIAGLGRENMVKIGVDDQLGMDPAQLEQAILTDQEAGLYPLCVVATLGTTGTTAVDPLGPVAAICKRHGIWLHVDAAFAGTALVLPEYQWMIEGIEEADSFVFNPHKWMFTNFDCTAYYVKDAETLVKTFEILPEYLKTRPASPVKNFKDWGIPLGRRFRALKLWFVIRNFGVTGIQDKIREHIRLAHLLASWVEAAPDFVLMTDPKLSLVCFRFQPEGETEKTLDSLNQALLHQLNQSGKLYLTHTRVGGKYVLRMVTAQARTTETHVQTAWELITSVAQSLKGTTWRGNT